MSSSDDSAHSEINSLPNCTPFPYFQKGLRGKRLRLLVTYPTDDAGADSDLPRGTLDVIALSDTPNINLNVRVNPVGNPERVAFVSFDQLALYDGRR